MAELLLEVGCEELPANAIRHALVVLAENLKTAISGAKLLDDHWSQETACTPRRLIVCIRGVKASQPSETIEKRGPSVKAAFDDEGKPTAALIGFCKAQHADVSQVEVRGDYVWIRTMLQGKPAKAALSEVVPKAIESVPFEKTMRWGAGKLKFARPIRWVVCLLDGDLVPFTIESVGTSRVSRGHRFFEDAVFEVSNYDSLMSGLRERRVEPSPDMRRKRIFEEACTCADGKAVLSESLIEENVYLTEWPQAVEGKFREVFLQLPASVLKTVMAKHHRFFPVEAENGRLTNRFISIINGGEPATVRRGNEWVLNARLNDAKFFYEEDSRFTLEEFLGRTSSIVFQEQLGTIRDRADRISKLAALIATQSGLPSEEIAFCEKAGRLCKADLSTGMVSELPELQGVVGGEYARRDGYEPEICGAIASHYAPSMSPQSAGERIGLIVMCADQADRLAGYLGIGEEPKGSSDPFALRKSVTMLIEAQVAWNGWGENVSGVCDWVLKAAKEYREKFSLDDDEKISKRLKHILEGRYEAMFSDIPYDVLDAAWSSDWLQRSDLFISRARAVASLSSDISFVRTAKRAGNIVKAANEKGIVIRTEHNFAEIDEHLFESAAEKALLEAGKQASQDIEPLLRGHKYLEIAERLRALAAPIDSFFRSVMVMTDDLKRRENRLKLLANLAVLFWYLGDFDKIVIEGE